MSLIMFLHISMGTIAVIAGAAALITRKGSRMHRGIGNVFFATMAVMAVAGTYLAIAMPMALTALAGIFTLYLIATSWMAARQIDESTGLLHYAALATALAVAAAGFWFGSQAANSPDGLKDGLPAFPHYFFGALALLAAAGDVILIARREISGKQRIARHLWRMCFAYFIAAGSLFTGPGASAFPDAVRDSGILSLPEPLILLVMLFWLVRVLATKWADGSPSKSTDSAASAS